MNTYLLVSFWLGVFGFVVRISQLMCYDWPHEQRPKTIGIQVAETLIGLAFALWAALVLWA